MGRVLLRLSSVGCCLFLGAIAFAGPPDGPKSIFDLMHYQEVLDITLEVDLDSIVAGRRSTEAFETRLSFQDEEGRLLRWNAEVSVRGRFRRVHCQTPPLRLNFKKSQLRDFGLAAFDDLKVVTHCMEDPYLARELLLKEYLVYKMYNRLTDYSYRVQMVRVTYKNPETEKADQQWGFLIEDTAQLRDRTATGKVDDVLVMPLDTLRPEQFRIVGVFQYMIGNMDWGIEPSKNLDYLQAQGEIIPVPYDFDFSKLVDAPYAKVWTGIGNDPLKHITSLSMLAADEGYAETLAFFQRKRRALLSTARRLKILSFDNRKAVVDYLKAFFEYNGMVMEGYWGR